jgi:hypothetical protein
MRPAGPTARRQPAIARPDLTVPESARRLAREAGVDWVALGTLADLGDQLRLSVRLIDAATSATLGTATVAVAKDARAARMLETGRTDDDRGKTGS